MSKSLFRELLDKEASPALGCTEPMMFALAAPSPVNMHPARY